MSPRLKKNALGDEPDANKNALGEEPGVKKNALGVGPGAKKNALGNEPFAATTFCKVQVDRVSLIRYQILILKKKGLLVGSWHETAFCSTKKTHLIEKGCVLQQLSLVESIARAIARLIWAIEK